MKKIKEYPSITKSDTRLLMGFGLIDVINGEVYLTEKAENYQGVFDDIINLLKKVPLRLLPFCDDFNVFLPSRRESK